MQALLEHMCVSLGCLVDDFCSLHIKCVSIISTLLRMKVQKCKLSKDMCPLKLTKYCLIEIKFNTQYNLQLSGIIFHCFLCIHSTLWSITLDFFLYLKAVTSFVATLLSTRCGLVKLGMCCTFWSIKTEMWTSFKMRFVAQSGTQRGIYY